jgi:hypothetical protein
LVRIRHERRRVLDPRKFVAEYFPKKPSVRDAELLQELEAHTAYDLIDRRPGVAWKRA